MSDNLNDVQHDDLLLQDVGLMRDELGALPVLDLSDEVEEQILRARKNLEPDTKSKSVPPDLVVC